MDALQDQENTWISGADDSGKVAATSYRPAPDALSPGASGTHQLHEFCQLRCRLEVPSMGRNRVP
jgi:hypothetical protein